MELIKRTRRRNKKKSHFLHTAILEQIQWTVTSRIAFQNIPRSLDGAHNLVLTEKARAHLDASVSNGTMRRHFIELDLVIDQHYAALADLLKNNAEDKDMIKFGVCSDESPRAAYRYQITHIYVPSFHAMNTWTTSRRPPLKVSARPAQIVVAASKAGSALVNLLALQAQTQGWDLKTELGSGVFDRDAQNTGSEGVIKIISSTSPSFVSSPCVCHISWSNAKRVSETISL